MKKITWVSPSELTQLLKVIIGNNNCDWKNLKLEHLPIYVRLLTKGFQGYEYPGSEQFIKDVIVVMSIIETIPLGMLEVYENVQISHSDGNIHFSLLP